MGLVVLSVLGPASHNDGRLAAGGLTSRFEELCLPISSACIVHPLPPGAGRVKYLDTLQADWW